MNRRVLVPSSPDVPDRGGKGIKGPVDDLEGRTEGVLDGNNISPCIRGRTRPNLLQVQGLQQNSPRGLMPRCRGSKVL
jgi:hypothetical protein